MKNLAILMTALTIFGVQTSGIASEQLDANGVNYVSVEVCGDVVGKEPGSDCIKVSRYLWGLVGQARLIPSQTLRNTGGRYSSYNLVIDSRGCFPVHSTASPYATYEPER